MAHNHVGYQTSYGHTHAVLLCLFFRHSLEQNLVSVPLLFVLATILNAVPHTTHSMRVKSRWIGTMWGPSRLLG